MIEKFWWYFIAGPQFVGWRATWRCVLGAALLLVAGCVPEQTYNYETVPPSLKHAPPSWYSRQAPTPPRARRGGEVVAPAPQQQRRETRILPDLEGRIDEVQDTINELRRDLGGR